MKIIRNHFWYIILAVLAAILMGIIVALIVLSRDDVAKEIKVGAVFIDDVNDGGWSEKHYEGLKKVCDDMGLPLEIMTNISETDASAGPAIEQLVAKGCSTIFLTSEGYGKDLYPVINKYPEVRFYTVSADSDPSNSATYFCRLSEVRYLSGIVAGNMTKSNVIGFIAGGQNPQTSRGINAFALGVRSVNPKAKVRVKYLDSWTDPEMEYEYAKKLITDDNADIICYHCTLHTAIDAAEELGVYSIGYNTSKKYSDLELTSLLCDWSVVYRAMIEDFLKGAVAPGKRYWIGMDEGAVKMTEFSSLVPEDVKQLVEQKKAVFYGASGVFQGEIISNTGEVICRKGERISDAALLKRLNWFVEGVEFDE